MEDGIIVRRGDIIRFEAVGGGGYGHPFDRDPLDVLQDVLGGFVSAASALQEYGVVLAQGGQSVDHAATQAHRQQTRRETKLFHRDGFFDADAWYQRYART
jgi:N-methylhydantoinase B